MGEPRTQFERDFDRAVFSTPVKRLQDKAQVFPLEPHDAVRTRLTHSLEVSSVARGLGRGVAQWLVRDKYLKPESERAIEAIAATCGLIHDLGNPPFGHAGEEAIRYWFEKKFTFAGLQKKLVIEQLANDFLLFEGNAQSLRLVGKLQILADFNGLNLTFGTLSALCKYTAPSHQVAKDGDHAHSKPGFFASEQELINRIRLETGTGTARNPITFLVEAADDIVYSVADIEDGVKKGILVWKNLNEELLSEKDSEIEAVMKSMEKILKVDGNEISAKLPDDVYASAFRTAVIARLVPSVIRTFKREYEAILGGTYKGELLEDCDAKSIPAKLKKIARDKVYCTNSTLKLEIMGRNVICDLMDIFWEGAEKIPVNKPPIPKEFHGKIGALFSQNYLRVFQHSIEMQRKMPETHFEIPEMYYRLQLVTDYVCGMTDTFAKTIHSELTNG